MNTQQVNKATRVRFRPAARRDVPAVAAMLADDLLGYEKSHWGLKLALKSCPRTAPGWRRR
ncbi:MAG: hypothetical protein IH996_08185 [Proteobacteria bacterium]|nr:hypothetical protein [Pseudomonadota bacterium]